MSEKISPPLALKIKVDECVEGLLRSKLGGVLAISLLTATLAIKTIPLIVNGQSEVKAADTDPSNQSINPQVNYTEQYLRRPGLNGEPSFMDKMAAEEVSIYFRQVLGNQHKVASAGRDQYPLLEFPNPNQDESTAVVRLSKGDCFTWEKEVVVSIPDGTFYLYGINYDGFWPIHKSKDGVTQWEVNLNDPECRK